MKSFSLKFYTFSYGFIRVLSLIFTGVLLLGGFLGTCYALDMTTQEALSRWDNPVVNLAGLAVFFLFISLLKWWVCQGSARRLPLLLLLVLAWCTILGVLLILFSKTVPAADAMSVYAIAESLAGGDTSVIHPTDSYLSYYPQQVGLAAFFELLIRIWNLLPTGLPAYHMIKCVYVLLAWVIILFQYRTVRLLWKDDQVSCIYLILMGANLPFFMYTSFVYGEIPSFAAMSIGLYCLFRVFALLSEKADRLQAWLLCAASLLMLTLSVFLRKNSLIVIIAAILVILFQWLKTKRFPLLWLALLCGICSITVLPLTQKYYERRAGNTLSSGVPAMSYFAMGMQEASRGNGWYNGFNFYTYQDTGMDAAETAAVSRAAIAKRLAYFREHPGYAANFYLHKYLSQWADGTYACRQATLATFGGRRSFFDSLYAGEGSICFIAYCNHYQNVIYLGVFLFCLGNLISGRHRHLSSSKLSENIVCATEGLKGLPLYLGLISAFGGFLFHMAWEANSRYIFVYGLLLLPYAARGLAQGDAYLCKYIQKPIFPIKNQISRRKCLPMGIILLVITLLCGLLLFGYFRTVRYHSDQARQNDIRALAQEEYNGLFLSMYPTEPFDAENFSYYRGIPTLKADHRFETLADMGDYLRTALGSGQEIASIYIGLDAPAIAGQYGFHSSLYHREYQKQLLQLVSANPQTAFEILLPYYSLAHWDSLSADRRAEYINSYRNLVNIFIGQPNVTIYFLGYEEWLTANPGNYDAPDSCSPSVTSTLLLLTFQDDDYALTPDNMEEHFAALEALIASYADKGEQPFSTPDLSSYEIVFFGDSVIGNYTDSLSIPGAVQGLSGAHTFNLGKGGTKAIMSPDSSLNLNAIVDALLAKDADMLATDSQPYFGLREYLENTVSEEAGTNTKTCFVINYGLNDFFSGSPISSEEPLDTYTYKGSLRTAVAKLQEAYPDSMILLNTPNFCTYFGNGTQPQDEQGGKLTDYVNAVQEICDELGLYCVDNYNNLGINAENQEEYLIDGCHPSELGRYRIAQHILQAMESQIENQIESQLESQ